ncbi:uncharacterized protein LOC143055862 [Mytilus galloprovincialis]|uniref:uncharacterized protein LOC143055862 n=1 Tax=Mytilus galloprovincialis TaxID=29158 RepID=UPI003F7C37E8
MTAIQARVCDFHKFSTVTCNNLDPYVHIFECQRSTERHLIGLKSSETIPGKPFEKLECPESLLILFRSGIFTLDKLSLNLNICESHRAELGLNWRRGKVQCTYPDHNDGSKAKADRGANPTVCKELWLKTRQILPIGSEICKQCSTKHKKTVSSHLEVNFKDELVHLQKILQILNGDDGQFYELNREDLGKDSCSDDVMDTESSEPFSCYTGGTSQETCSQDWLEAQRTPREKLNKAMEILSSTFQPLQSQLQKPWNSISNSMRSYYSKKTFECVEIVLSIIAPNQECFLLESMYKKFSKTQEMCEIDQTTKTIINAYNNVTDSRTQTQILSLIVNSFTKAELQKLIPGISLFKIDSARKHALVTGPGHIINKPKVYRMKLTKPKLTHFIEFIMNPLYSSVVGFGQTVLKLSSNEKIPIPKVIRNLIHARIISIYQSFCKEYDFETFSRASLYRILKVCHASKQRALQGLDNITAAGMNSIDMLSKLVQKLETFGMSQPESKSLTDIIQLINQFLKYEYKSHLNRLDGCTDHCTTMALSDPTEPKFSASCNHNHERQCEKCAMVESCLDMINEKINQIEIPTTILEEMKFEMEMAEKHLMEWKKHLLRTVHQESARRNILKSLTTKQALVIMDWAMKFLPFQYRETQSEFFEKKGFSWHISCVITTSKENELDLQCYIHILENGTQGWFSVANILVNLLDQLKTVNPEIDELFLKSDNAACYHCTNLLSFIQQNNAIFPILIKEYNFSEAQSGKDLCDSKTGTSRLHIYKYANDGHNVVSSADMKIALDSHCGIRGTQVSIISVNQDDEPHAKVKIPGISMLNNFTFGGEAITARKAYEVGEGLMIKTSTDPHLSMECVYKMKVVQPFPGPNEQPAKGTVTIPITRNDTDGIDNTCNNEEQRPIEPVADVNSNESEYNMPYFCCPDDSCDKVFAKSCNLEMHLTIGNHNYRTNPVSCLDTAVQIYAGQCESVLSYNETLVHCTSEDQHNINMGEINEKGGWALKGKRLTARFSENVKKYLQNICISCEKTGTRPNYYQLSEELRKVTDENGQKMFVKKEWLTPSQIRGYVAQFISKSRANITASKVPRVELCEVSVDEDEKLSAIVNMLDVNELNSDVSSIVTDVFSSVGI